MKIHLLKLQKMNIHLFQFPNITQNMNTNFSTSENHSKMKIHFPQLPGIIQKMNTHFFQFPKIFKKTFISQLPNNIQKWIFSFSISENHSENEYSFFQFPGIAQ